jgi:[ribosomal protein S5]-alanine N-acetyltransferase
MGDRPDVPVLDTPRLRLRTLREDDAAAVYAYGRDPAVTRFVSWPRHRSLDDATTFLEYAATAVSSGREMQWALARRDDDTMIGTAGVRLQGHRVELGYVIAQPHWGRGYATEAATRIVQWALENPAVVRVWAYCHVDNAASARVLEKAGMVREGRLSAWVVFPNLSAAAGDCWCYARVRR